MGVYQVRMPQLGETVDEGTIVAWLKQPGDTVSEQEALLEISTEKVDTEIESAVTGVLERVLVDEGETVVVGTVLAEIDTGDSGAREAAPSVEAAEAIEPEAEAPAAEDGPASGSDLLLSPVVRRLVDEHAIDVDDLAAFADKPRITRGVVEDYLNQRAGKMTGEATGEQLIPFTRVRKLTAERMAASKATSAHVVTAMEVDFEEVARVRARHRERLQSERGVPLTWLPFVASAVARTLGQFERLNASVRDGEGLVVRSEVHLGIAVDLDGEGLVVPVIRDAAGLGLVDMAARIQEAAESARAGALQLDDVTGGTFTITGQGPHGTLFTAPIINQPQVAILSVDGIRKRPVVIETNAGDEIAAHHTGVLAMSWDHRAVDGAYAAGFLAALRDAIEQHDWAAELA
jgi:pyruvate dehydrogenase E2 component (dihydrolipoamide acetyltransferase)